MKFIRSRLTMLLQEEKEKQNLCLQLMPLFTLYNYFSEPDLGGSVITGYFVCCYKKEHKCCADMEETEIKVFVFSTKKRG